MFAPKTDQGLVSLALKGIRSSEELKFNAFVRAFIKAAEGDEGFMFYAGTGTESYLPPGIITADGTFMIPYVYPDGTSFNVPFELLAYKPEYGNSIGQCKFWGWRCSRSDYANSVSLGG